MINVLDKGFVRLVDSMGNDSAIVQAARVSYGDGTKTTREDQELINYLLRNKHTSPFEMVEFKFHCKMPIFIARQWVRHRTASINEYSGRYSEMPNEFYVPTHNILGTQSKTNKQGTDGKLDTSEVVVQKFYDEQLLARDNYLDKLDMGMSREHARINLPLSQYTEWYWKINLHNLLHFLQLRLDSHAQYEIREYARAIYDLIQPIVPITCEAFKEYRLNSLTFSYKELSILSDLLKNSSLNPELITQPGNFSKGE